MGKGKTERKEGNEKIEAVAVQEAVGLEEQPPGRVLFTQEGLKPLSRGKVRSGWKEGRGNGARGEGRRKGAGKVSRGELRRETGHGHGARAWPGEGWRQRLGPSGAGSVTREARGRWRAHAEVGRQRQAGERGEGREGSAGIRRLDSVGPSGAAWGA